MPTISLITLGCAKNIVEGESIAGLLESQGLSLTTRIEEAEYALIHTCSFIADARAESAGTIRAVARLKRKGRLKKLFVSGCLVQAEKEKIQALFPEVDGFIGTGQLERLPELIGGTTRLICGKPGGLLETETPRMLSSALPSAYLRLSEGCNHRCSFCLIPSLRGRYHSRSISSIVGEAEALAENGVRELNLIGQDTSWYGRDLYGSFALPRLLKKLARIGGVRWIRLMYAYPSTVTGELLSTMRDEEKICSYLDIPLQHVSAGVLKRMRRPENGRKTVEKILKAVPGITLRTALIVGFPGETRQEFAELYDFVSGGSFEHLGVFEYSEDPGMASARLGGKVPGEVKRDRKKMLMQKQLSVVKEKNRSRINSTHVVLAESLEQGRSGPRWSGRASFQAPEIDSRVNFTGHAKAGTFVRVKMTGIEGYDLGGKAAQ
ncbi:MAG: 30S ribosomal protein S12 methylthiotransferase RimO [Endomicrobiales bacterium]